MLISKEPVVGTHIGIFGDETTRQTFTRYRAETQTFVISPEIQKYQRDFTQHILDGKTTIACLVAPFGYGKTSTVIHIWQACDREELLAIPPFSCNSVSEMGQAIATAVIFQLEDAGYAAHAGEVRLAYNEYLISSAQRLAERDASRYSISYETALHSILDKIQDGYLQLEASGTHLISFLEKIVTIALDADYKGLVVIVDEFQQFLGNINKTVITNFRTLIWGLKTRGVLPLGFLITMDPDTERNLIDRGADILHRIRKDGLYLDFSNIYGREFPRELWSRYAQSFGFTRDSQSIVDNATLESIGQICERPDLGNGPRTVINIFQRIAALYAMRHRAYTPIDLIDDFLAGDIRFDGDRGKIASLVNELTSYDYIKRIPARVDMLKLFAAFPRGCSSGVADFYGLSETFAQLSDELRGEVLVQLPEGMALIDLQKVGKPQNKLNIILKKYWMQITEAEIISDRALGLFAEYAIQPLFPSYTSLQDGWKAEREQFQLTALGGYVQVYEGTFFEEFPNRCVMVQVCSSLSTAVQPNLYVDAHLVFVIQSSEKPDNSSVPEFLENPRSFILHIPIHQRFSRQLPRDIREIEDFLSPVTLTPGVLLSLLKYIDEHVPLIEGMSEIERQRIEDTRRKLQEHLLVMLFSGEAFAPYGITIYSRGSQAVRDALYHIFRRAYPNYQTLITGQSWRRLLAQYEQVLGQINGTQRRGIEPLANKKSELALCFDQRQYAGFESYARQFNGLLEIADWRGDSGALIFQRHPYEDNIIEAVGLQHDLSDDAVYELSREQGYLEEEVEYLIHFLLLRGYIERDPDTYRLRPAATFSRDELIGLGQDILKEILFVQDIVQYQATPDIYDHVNAIIEALQTENADLSDTQVRLHQAQRAIQQERPYVVQHLREQVQEQIDALYRYKAEFNQALSLSTQGLTLDEPINGAQRTLDKARTTAREHIEKQAARLRQAVAESPDLETLDTAQFESYLHRLKQQTDRVQEETKNYQSLLERSILHERWVQQIGKMKRLGDSLAVAAEITDVEQLRQNLERTIWQIHQELASEGLKQYRHVYETFEAPIRDLEQELDRLLTLANQRQLAHSETSIAGSQDVTELPEIGSAETFTPELHFTSPGKVDLRRTWERSQLSEREFLLWLIQQSEQGEVIIRKKGTR